MFAIRDNSDLYARVDHEMRAALYRLAAARPLVAVFGSARMGPATQSYLVARKLAQELGRAGFGIVTGGGPGIMEAANRGARDVGAVSLGASIVLPHEQRSNDDLDLEIRFEFFFARKLALIRNACGFVCFPGGFGTVDELFEALLLIQTEKLPHFPLVLFGTAYWEGLLRWVTETMEEAGAIAARDRGLLLVTDDIPDAVEQFRVCHRTLCATLGPGPHYPE